MQRTDYWLPKALPPPLHSFDIHIWCSSIKSSLTKIESMSLDLSAEETAKANSFASIQARNLFIVSRSQLRRLLSVYLGIPAKAIAFSEIGNGKPVLNKSIGLRLHFNLSHSGDLIAFAFTALGEIGIDIEKIRELEDPLNIAEKFFSKSEYNEIAKKPGHQIFPQFFRLWTAKEAYLKAVGIGINQDLKEFSIICSESERNSHVQVDNANTDDRSWMLTSFCPSQGYAGNWCVASTPRSVGYYFLR
ncbi:hypothetical protein CH373_15475 [Leptospira perolatii]|uniref:Uncharacterized protein n=1 Tax=Leptospira perolatii TaxID=2023191 RepID=A0A2M9ZJB7_9LEPT|nr:4'-phosphopantetheinyl transferase superfamily protein [Leptospira perolatii]PJZ68817.1 hypothetical protein CH360_13935 [Leptospira perolatii]PJZ72148.1 hypothetical protein CH373_15475 [Leptospira perolatii]